jgi:hypothetical protein
VNSKTTKIALLLAGCLCLALSQANATSLLPGQTVNNPGALPAGSVPTGTSTAVSSTGSANLLEEGSSWKFNGKTDANITFATGVWVDPSSGDLDFFYQIQNSFPKAQSALDNTVASSMTLTDFSGVGISNVYEVTYATKGLTGCAFFGAGPCPPDANGSGFLRPTTASVSSVARSSGAGSDLTVNFNGLGIAPGTNSAILVIETTAKDFDQTGSGTFTWEGAPPAGAVGSGPGQNTKGPWVLDALEPVVTPEPGFYGILALGIAGLLLIVRRRSEKAARRASTAA